MVVFGFLPKEDAEAIRSGTHPNDIAEENRDYYLERRYPAFGNLVPRDVASRAAKERCDAGYGVIKRAKQCGFAAAIMRYGAEEAHVKGVKNASDADIKAFGEKVVEANTVTSSR